MESTPSNWRKSTYSGNQGGHCVEVADTDTRVYVRDTQNRSLGQLSFPAADWRALLTALRR